MAGAAKKTIETKPAEDGNTDVQDAEKRAADEKKIADAQAKAVSTAEVGNAVEVEKEVFEAKADAVKDAAINAAAQGKLFGTGGTPGLELSDEDRDKETAKRAKSASSLLSDGPKHSQTAHFIASIAEVNGTPILSLSKVGWVGPAGFTAHAGTLDEVIEALNGLK